MIRRVLNAVLLLGGAVPLGWALARLPLDARRSAALGLLLLAGVVLNLTGLFRRHLGLRVWLRGLALVVGLGVLGAVGAVRWSAQQTLRGVSDRNVEAREHLHGAVQSLTYLGGGLIYVLVSVLALPPHGLAQRAQDARTRGVLNDPADTR